MLVEVTVSGLMAAPKRIEGAPGNDRIAPAPNAAGERRGWLEIATKYVFISGEPLMIVQHPKGEPLMLAFETNAVIAVNDNWKSTQEAEIAATGYAPPNDAEPAIVSTVAPGNYTAIVRF